MKQEQETETTYCGGSDGTRTRDLLGDSAPSFGNCLKLRGTDGYQNRAWEPQVTILGP
jgi:hypothetical protein